MGWSQSNNKLSEDDLKLISDLEFDADLFNEIRIYTDSSFFKASGNIEAEFGYKDLANYNRFLEKGVCGISLNESEDKAFSIIYHLREKFKEKGYFIYISETNSGYSPEEITILKTDDKFDVLRFEGTNGVNHDIFTEEIVNRLSQWDKEFGLDIFVAGFDVVQAYYLTTPKDLSKHCKDLYEFCPDIVEQGAETLENLKLVIARTKQLYLWWD